MERSGWPSDEIATQIYDRLCQDDPVASSDLAEAYLTPLAEWLRRTNSRVDAQFCDEAAGDAIIALIKNPRSYDPARLRLTAFLRMSATGDLRNILAKERRHQSHRADLTLVELFGADRNQEAGTAQEQAQDAVDGPVQDDRDMLMAMATGVVETFTPGERQTLELLIEGERRTQEFARVLDVSHLPQSEQRREVKRVKDRIKKRLQRARSQT